jgi:adenosylcobinamide-GDP ribazoletransferase
MPASDRGARAAWAWPLTGAFVGLVGWLVAIAGEALGLMAPAAAILTLAAMALLTGAMHEDGLADTADGLLGGRTRARRLEIMRDSRIGSFGALALILTVLMRWQALTVLLTFDQGLALIGVMALSRLPMALIMAALPHARGDGLAVLTGRPDGPCVAAAAALALVLAALTTGPLSPLLLLAALITATLVGAISAARIGGQTGDVLGAAAMLSEAVLLAIAAGALRT